MINCRSSTFFCQFHHYCVCLLFTQLTFSVNNKLIMWFKFPGLNSLMVCLHKIYMLLYFDIKITCANRNHYRPTLTTTPSVNVQLYLKRRIFSNEARRCRNFNHNNNINAQRFIMNFKTLPPLNWYSPGSLIFLHIYMNLSSLNLSRQITEIIKNCQLR